MATPGQPILDANGKPCLTPTGKPIIADAGGSASCACGVCPSYYKADYCSPGDCSLVTSVYFCSTWQAGCCHSGGCGGTTTRAIQVGDVVEYDGRCYRVNSLTTYPKESLPEGAIILTGAVSENSRVCMGPPWFACSDCGEINGYVSCDLACACIGSQGGGGLPPGGIFISCAALRIVLRDCPFCPIWQVEWPIGSGKFFCVLPNFNAPTQPYLPDGAVEVDGCGFSSCCACCAASLGSILPSCCSCSALGPLGCRSTTYRFGLSPIVTPYGCCWKFGSWHASGSGLRSDYYAGFPTYPFRTITAEASGHEVVTTYREYDTVTGALINTYSYTDPVAGDSCGFYPQSEIMTNSFGGGDPSSSRGTMTTQCDLLSWDYVNDNWPTGGVKTVSKGSIVIAGEPGACNGNPCQSLAFGESGTGCSNCVTLSLGVSVEDLEALA